MDALDAYTGSCGIVDQHPVIGAIGLGQVPQSVHHSLCARHTATENVNNFRWNTTQGGPYLIFGRQTDLNALNSPDTVEPFERVDDDRLAVECTILFGH